MKIVTFADLHLGVSSYGYIDPNTGLNTRVLNALSSFDKMIDYCIDNEIKYVIFAGDMFKNNLPTPTLQKELNLRIKKGIDNGIVFYMQDGNHDVSPIITAKSAMDPFNTLGIQNVKHTRFEAEFFIEDIRVLMLPTYCNQEEVENILKKYNDNIKTIVVGHNTILGAKLNDWLIETNESAIDGKIFKQKNIISVVLGHLHKHQILDTNPLIYYTGSLQRIDFNEENQPKGFVELNINNNIVNYRFIEIESQEFKTIKLDLTNIDNEMEFIQNYIDKEHIENKIVRLQLQVKKDNNINDGVLLTQLKDKNVRHIAYINKNFNRQELIRDEEFDELISEQQALKKYFDNFTNKDELITIGLEMINKLKNDGLI